MFNPQAFSRDLKIQKLNYKLGESVDHSLIKNHLSKLNEFNLSSLKTDEEKKAFWINTYNGLTNYLIIDLRIKKSMKESTVIFKQKYIKIDNIPFSLDDIEHGVLRKNARNHLSANDDILKHQVNVLDYRIHFSLNCGAASCPMIAFYTKENIDEELAEAEAVFVETEFEIDSVSKVIKCSSLFEWYKDDFQKYFTEHPVFASYEIILKDYNWNI